MPVNKSDNKVYVTKLFGGSATQGVMDPAVNMRVRLGIDNYWVVGLAPGNAMVDLSLASGGPVVRQSYPDDLYVETPVASGFGWPNGSGCVVWGNDWNTGVPVRDTSRMTVMGGNGSVTSFVR